MEYRLSAHSTKKGNIELESGYIFLDKNAAIEAYDKTRYLLEEEQGLSMNIRNIWEQRPMYDIVRSEKIECEDGDEVSITLIEVERPVSNCFVLSTEDITGYVFKDVEVQKYLENQVAGRSAVGALDHPSCQLADTKILTEKGKLNPC